MGKLRKWLVPAGAVLLVVGLAVLLAWQWGIHRAAEKAQAYVSAICSVIPQPQGAAPEGRRENTMSVLSVDGKDFVGILELPGYGSKLPVGASWGDSGRYPCRFSGSIYDGSLCIGATSQKGQYDFYREISVGDSVLFTDMEGNRYSYQVADIRYVKHADQESLHRTEGMLTLFIKNVYAFEYMVVSCNR